jgi:hypothetical protein
MAGETFLFNGLLGKDIAGTEENLVCTLDMEYITMMLYMQQS